MSPSPATRVSDAARVSGHWRLDTEALWVPDRVTRRAWDAGGGPGNRRTRQCPGQHPRTRSEDIGTSRTRMAALGCAALLISVTTGCHVAQTARAGSQLKGAVEQLMSREAVSVEATFGASADEVYDYLLRSAEQSDGEQATREEARLLSLLELTAVVGAPGGESTMLDLTRDSPLDSALSVSFGGKDAVGVKTIESRTYTRVSLDTVIRDAHGAGPHDPTDAELEAALSAAERFTADAGQLPPSLEVASRALQGNWAELDPHRYPAYADALTEGTDIDPGPAQDIAAALADAGPLLEPAQQWQLVDGLSAALRQGASMEQLGEQRGAELVRVRLSAGSAREALRPLLDLLTVQSERFGLPPVVQEPADPDAKVTAELAIRNGVLASVTFDLGQFGGREGAELPLELALAGGAAISLTAPEAEGLLDPRDLTVALMYLDVQRQEREEDPERANIPGPLQP